MPVFSQKQMANLISRRNTKFTSAVNEFLNQCTSDDVDPVAKILQDFEPYIPTPSTSRNHTPLPEQSKKTGKLPPTIPEERKAITDIINDIKQNDWYTGQIVPDGHRVPLARREVLDQDPLLTRHLDPIPIADLDRELVGVLTPCFFARGIPIDLGGVLGQPRHADAPRPAGAPGRDLLAAPRLARGERRGDQEAQRPRETPGAPGARRSPVRRRGPRTRRPRDTNLLHHGTIHRRPILLLFRPDRDSAARQGTA